MSKKPRRYPVDIVDEQGARTALITVDQIHKDPRLLAQVEFVHRKRVLDLVAKVEREGLHLVDPYWARIVRAVRKEWGTDAKVEGP